MIEIINNELALMLTGSTMAVFGGTLYKAYDSGVIFGGHFRNKYETLVAFLVSMALMGWVTTFVEEIWTEATAQLHFSTFDMLGAVLIAGMIAVNHEVKRWTYTDPKSVTVYGIGLMLIFIL